MMQYVANRALTISGVRYAPGEVIDPIPLKPRTLQAMLEQRQIGPSIAASTRGQRKS